jgi:branched-chain amino acid transport system ATP-binding protein
MSGTSQTSFPRKRESRADARTPALDPRFREGDDGSGLVIDGVEAGYGDTVVIEGIALDLPPGGTMALLGRNGVGKTTLLATIIGHTRLHAGHIRFRGVEISGLPPYRRARLGIGLVPQEREVFPSLSVEENLEVAAVLGSWSLARVYDLFPPLASRRRNRGNQLSGGEQQMLAIGRALMGNPNLLLMDEPLEGLAPVIVDALLQALKRLKSGGDLAILLVEQHARLALEFAERTIVLDRGRAVFSGPSRELLDAPERLGALMGVGARSAR